MAARVVFFVQHGSFEPAFQASSMAITAAAMGDEVWMVFAWDGLRQLARGSYGLPEKDRERHEQARSEGLGLPNPLKMLQEARSLGVRLVACESIVKMCGFDPAQLNDVLDEVMGLASIWRLTEGARTIS
ncbi:MAG: DsrE family protein, partial [Myxococcaceae bacterium]